MQNGNLKMVDTTQAKGTDQRPGRNLEYGANQLFVEFNDNNQIQKITGVDQARVVSNRRHIADHHYVRSRDHGFRDHRNGQHFARPPWRKATAPWNRSR